MRREVEMMPKPTAAKNGQERVATKPDNTRHLEYCNNEQWRHSDKCREFTNRDCKVKRSYSSS